jgi:hypothetical protein
MQFSVILRELRIIDNVNPISPQAIEVIHLMSASGLRLVLTDFTQKRTRKSRKQRSLQSEGK